MLGDYYDGPVAPLFPFGHGVGYTAFEYASLEVVVSEEQATVQIGHELRNVGRRAGVEVVQLYARDEVASVARPVRSLIGFAKVGLEPGAAARVHFIVDLDRLGFHGSDLRYRVEPGTWAVMVGASSADIRLRGHFEVRGSVRHPDPNRVRPTVVEVEPTA